METLTDQPIVADASRQTPNTQDLSGSAHPERCSATSDAVRLRVLRDDAVAEGGSARNAVNRETE